jgi:cytochrome c oxidase cbb3-type subunit III
MQPQVGARPIPKRSFLFLFAGWLAAGGSLALGQSAAQKPARSNSLNPSGQRLFASTCASCHGLDGRGGERAPNIAQKPEIQRLSDAALTRTVQDGVTGTGMPAFHSLAVSEVKAIVIYLRTLQGANQAAVLPGDPERGKELFFAKAGCSSCHMVAGSGGFIASDLSGFARTHSAVEVRTAVTKPSVNPDRPSVVATTRDGHQYAGRIRNEDNFSLQLQTLDGAFQFLSKSDLERVERNPQGPMPADYSSTLSPKELDDLVSYLIVSAKTSESPSKKGMEDRE